jgi:hypothetical protein
LRNDAQRRDVTGKPTNTCALGRVSGRNRAQHKTNQPAGNSGRNRCGEAAPQKAAKQPFESIHQRQLIEPGSQCQEIYDSLPGELQYRGWQEWRSGRVDEWETWRRTSLSQFPPLSHSSPRPLHCGTAHQKRRRSPTRAPREICSANLENLGAFGVARRGVNIRPGSSANQKRTLQFSCDSLRGQLTVRTCVDVDSQGRLGSWSVSETPPLGQRGKHRRSRPREGWLIEVQRPPQGFAAVRNAAVNFLKLSGDEEITRNIRQNALQVGHLLATLGIVDL